MIRTFRYPLQPTRDQEAVLNSWLTACQQLYNGALQERRDAFEKAGVRVSKFVQNRELAQLRQEDPEWAEVPSAVLRSAIARLDCAFQAFFRRCELGEVPGFPRFKSEGRYDSFSVPGEKIEIDVNRVRLPKLGKVKFHEYRPIKGKVLECRVRRSAFRWWVCFVCELGEAPTKIPIRSAIGIDLGLSSFAVLSDGTRVENPKFFQKGKEVLVRRQQTLARCQRGSNSRQKQKILVGRAHEHVHNQRLDFSRKLAAGLVTKFDLIAHEDLQIARMVRGSFGKSINDAAWGLFLHALNCKAEYAGKTAVAVDPRGTSQICSNCGQVVAKSIAEREHVCFCGFVVDRDHNAALNVLALGRSAMSKSKNQTVGSLPE